MMNRKETIWFQRNVSVLNTVMTMIENTINETVSCMTFSWMRLKGPPFCAAPMWLAGIMNEYSSKATPHESRIMRINGQSFDEGATSGNFS